MKKLFLFFTAGCLIVSCSNKKKESATAKNDDWTSQHLHGKVKSYEETSYTPDSSGKTGAMDSCCIESSQFDEKGYNISTKSTNSNGTVKSETTITHYDAGQVKEFSSMANGKKTSGFTIDIDKDGKYSGGKSYDSTGKMTAYYTDLKEDEYAGVTAGTQHNPDSSIKSSFVAEYDKGLQMSTTSKDSTGKVTFTYKAELNDKDNISKVTTTETTKDSTTTKVVTYTYDSYDDQGNWTQRTTFDEKGKATKVVKRAYTYYKKD